MEQEIRFCTSADGTRIAYATYGNAAAQPLVLVNMFEQPQESFWQNPPTRAIYEGLAMRRRLVTYDRRGVGGSQRDVDDLAIAAQVADVAAVIDQLGLERFDLTGFGNGGTVSSAYTATHPERVGRLVFWQPLVRTSEAELPGLTAMPTTIRADWPMARRGWASIAYPNGPLEMQRILSNTMRDSVTPETAARHFEVIIGFNADSSLRNIDAPTLVLVNSGAHVREIGSVRALASLIPSARLVTLEGDFATPMLDSRQLVNAILEFVDEADAETEAAPPEGMTAILFLDIADSTALTTKLGDAAYRERERELDTSLRSAITDAGGMALKGKLLGDGILSVYKSAKDAISAALRCRDLGNQADLPLHLGIHAGDVIHEENDVRGGAVQLASRVQSLAATGEILVSATVRDLARTSAEVAFEDRGEHDLKGIPEPQRLFAVRTEGSPQEQD